MHSKQTYESFSLLLKEGRYTSLGTTCECYKCPDAQHQVKQKCSCFVWTWQESTISVYPDVTFQNLLKNIQLFGMLIYQYYWTVYNTHYKQLIHENCQYNYSHIYECTSQHNYNTYLNSLPAKKINIKLVALTASIWYHQFKCNNYRCSVIVLTMDTTYTQQYTHIHTPLHTFAHTTFIDPEIHNTTASLVYFFFVIF
jgi:uncharacterized protein YaaR (DUF327 family)